MDKKKVICHIDDAVAFLNNLYSYVNGYNSNSNLTNALKALKMAMYELRKPSLEDYIQALPYLTFDEDKYGENALKVTDNDWAYAPTLYKFEGKWLVDWVGGEDHDSGKVIEGSTPIEAARNAYNYCVNRDFIKDTLHHG